MRYQSGTLPTKYTFTGQYSYAGSGEFGLMYYGARWYDVSLGRFAQADSIVPGVGNPMAWDRYAYAMNSPVVYSDPSGHCNMYMYENGQCPDGELPTVVTETTTPTVPPSIQTANAPCQGSSCIFPPPTMVPTSGPVPTPTTTPEPITSDDIANLIEKMTDGLDFIDFMREGVDALVPNPALAFWTGTYAQGPRDEGENLTPEERTIRGLAAGAENVMTDVASTAIALPATVGAVALFSETGPIGAGTAGFVAYTTSTVSTNIILDNVFSDLNQNLIFPFINIYFGE